MKPIITWVLIADLASARILENTVVEGRRVQRAVHAFKAPDILSYSDDEGRTMAGTTSARVRLNRHVEHTPESESLVRQIVELLNDSLRNKAYDRLILCAGPSMLGMLRKHLPGEVTKVIRAEIPKNFVNTPNTKISKYLSDVISRNLETHALKA